MKIIGTVKGRGNISFQRDQQCTLINLHYYNQSNCNEFVNGEFIPIKHKNRKQLEKAHHNICENFILDIEADLTEDGKLVNFRVIQ